MSEALKELRSAVENRGKYWESENLIETYFDDHILPKLKCALEEVLPTIEDRHKFAPDDKNDEKKTCVHYTSIGRLFEMLNVDEKRKIDQSFLKLYDSVHLNDPDEGNYLLRQFNQSGHHGWLGLDSPQLSEVHDSEVAYIFSFVLSKDGKNIEDNLVFWRTYGNEGRGCSLTLPISHKHLKRVLYGEQANDTVKILEPILDALLPLFDAAKQVTRTVRMKAINEITNSLKGIVYLYKSSAYEYENEVRIVELESDINRDGKKIHFDYQEGTVGRPWIRHYVDFDKGSLKALLSTGSIITVGPTVPHRENVRQYLERIMENLNLPGPEIKMSEISYRLP